jgi:hypothetical protein
VISHDFADGFNTYTITSLYGNNRRRALTLLASDALAPVIGAAITLAFTIPSRPLGLYLGSSRGSCCTSPLPTSFLKRTRITRAGSPSYSRSEAPASCGS